MGLKLQDLYKISFQEYISQNPELKKVKKETQNQRYNLYEEERKKNIQRCIDKRKELITSTKKTKNNLRNNKKLEIDTNNSLNNSKSQKLLNRRNNSYLEDKGILITDNTYIMNKRYGGRVKVTKDDLNLVTCLKNEKINLEKKAEDKEDYLLKILRSELMREKNIQKIQDKIDQKDRKIKLFLKKKYRGYKYMQNERYLDDIDICQRQKIYEKIISNYEGKINIANKQNNQKKAKIKELKQQINDYEKKNMEYKEKINEMFELKDNDKKVLISYQTPVRGRLVDMDFKFELDKFKRENALMSHMNQYQNKINGYLEKSQEKEKKINRAIKKAEKLREEKRLINSIHFDEVREKIKNKQKRYEKEMQKKLENLEKKDLRDFAIKQEKIKMYEERKKMNQLTAEETQAIKSKIKEILREKGNLNQVEEDEKLLNSIINN